MIRKFFMFMALLCAFVFVLPAYAADPAPEGAAAKEGPSWFTRCEGGKDTDPKRGRCEVFQRLIHNPSKSRIIEFAIGYPESKPVARGIVVLPLGILLQPGVQMKIDDGQVFGFKIRYCDENGCYAYLDLDEKVLAQFAAGSKVTIGFQSTKPQKIEIVMSLKGFSAALKEVS